MSIKITPLIDSPEFYIVPYEKKSEFPQLCLKFEIDNIELHNYEFIKRFLEHNCMDSVDYGYIITKFFEGDYKDKQTFRVQNNKTSCVIHRIIL